MLRPVYRGVVAVLGVAVIVGGIVLLPLPGPGWLIIFLGLAILGTEFAWARRLLHYARQKVGEWTRWVAARSWWTRAALGAGTLVLVGAAATGYALWQGIPTWLPVIG